MNEPSTNATRLLDVSYEQARARFLGSAERAGAQLESYPHPLIGIEGEHLAIDIAQTGATDARSILLIVSATHGVEGYAGSALQSWWLDERASNAPDDVRVVLIHALNPFGFSWVRRVNEDNVDLNRNFVDWATPPTNDGYREIADSLVPLTWSDDAQTEANALLLEVLQRVGMERFHEMVSRGQYEYPSGLFYGGVGPTWSNEWMHSNLGQLVAPATKLGIIDIHTGLGDWAASELILHCSRDSPMYGRANAWWGDVRSMVDGDSVSSVLTGDWLGRVEAMLPTVEATTIALEYGTVDPVSVLSALRADAWLHGHGDPRGPEAAAIRDQVRAAFVDDDPAWLAAITTRFDEVSSAALTALRHEPSLLTNVSADVGCAIDLEG